MGSVLFPSGKADLLPSAQAKLNDVADALTQQECWWSENCSPMPPKTLRRQP